MRLSEITTEVYGYTTSVFMILVSCHYELSETQNSTPNLNWRWTINLLKLSPKNWRMYLHEIANFILCDSYEIVKHHNISSLGIQFLIFFLRFSIFQANLKLIPTYLFNRLHRSHKYFDHFLSYFKIRIVASKRKPPWSSLIKRSLSTFINKCLIVIQRESTLTLRGLSWPWRKRFVPGIISFVS